MIITRESGNQAPWESDSKLTMSSVITFNQDLRSITQHANALYLSMITVNEMGGPQSTTQHANANALYLSSITANETEQNGCVQVWVLALYATHHQKTVEVSCAFCGFLNFFWFIESSLLNKTAQLVPQPSSCYSSTHNVSFASSILYVYVFVGIRYVFIPLCYSLRSYLFVLYSLLSFFK